MAALAREAVKGGQAALGRKCPEAAIQHGVKECPSWVESGSSARVDAGRSIRLLDHPIGANKQRLRNREPQRVGGFQVDDQLVLSWRLHWPVRRFRTPQNSVDVGRGTSKLVGKVRSVGKQTAGGGIFRI